MSNLQASVSISSEDRDLNAALVGVVSQALQANGFGNTAVFDLEQNNGNEPVAALSVLDHLRSSRPEIFSAEISVASSYLGLDPLPVAEAPAAQQDDSVDTGDDAAALATLEAAEASAQEELAAEQV